MTNQEKKSILLTKLAILEGLVSDLSLLCRDDDAKELANRMLYFSKSDVELFEDNPKLHNEFKAIVERIEGDIEALFILTQKGGRND